MTNQTSTTRTQLTTDPDCRLEYIVTHETWYADAHRKVSPYPEITISKSAIGGGCACEFKLVDKTESIGRPVVQVCMFDDSWAAFAELAPLFAALAAEQPNTFGEVRVMLDEFGFVDATERMRPLR